MPYMIVYITVYYSEHIKMRFFYEIFEIVIRNRLQNNYRFVFVCVAKNSNTHIRFM